MLAQKGGNMKRTAPQDRKEDVLFVVTGGTVRIKVSGFVVTTQSSVDATCQKCGAILAGAGVRALGSHARDHAEGLIEPTPSSK